ncbi:MAG: carboxy-S-adenosyl-L-methionine synthase CmoA [Candidatus Thiodiazotropha taylori]|uniref:Carboxy-S-adenosyl-L-methionine synthase n=1 Tax=Candidatus Thiodiazotropha taylori TaxID=2792791 RepID=A0A9E4KBR8_9GAMM|nr:carboxy-S-adenosyl-L-methionine synthase CmoA [Candidatus Thiodiazotropha taylori]MCW4256931.1 carboxy-S-adenosyl-L-methionine synthase CmoA [Candidatus Thiodiazotropha taylori]
MKKDELYADPQQMVPDFVFDERVAKVFPDMINRSVPGYATIINMIGTLASRRVTRGSNSYDLGCSLGAASMAVRSSMPHQDYGLIAVDNSLPMLQQAEKLLQQDQADSPIQLVCSDVRNVVIERASMIILNFTLQFIPAEDRLDFLTQLYDGMQDNGLLVLSEKIALSNEASQNLFTEMHHSFKKAQGYSDLEISQKRSALENVLVPETLERHKQRLQKIGFSTVEVWFQCFNFVSLLAIK